MHHSRLGIFSAQTYIESREQSWKTARILAVRPNRSFSSAGRTFRVLEHLRKAFDGFGLSVRFSTLLVKHKNRINFLRLPVTWWIVFCFSLNNAKHTLDILSIDLCVCCCYLFNRFHMFHRMNIFIYLHWQYWPVLSKSIHSTTNLTQIPKSQWRYIIDFSIEFEINMINILRCELMTTSIPSVTRNCLRSNDICRKFSRKQKNNINFLYFEFLFSLRRKIYCYYIGTLLIEKWKIFDMQWWLKNEKKLNDWLKI